MSNLTDTVTRAHLKEVFGIFGTVVHIQMSSDKVEEVELTVQGVENGEEKESLGHAFIEYDDSDCVLIAIKHMDGGLSIM